MRKEEELLLPDAESTAMTISNPPSSFLRPIKQPGSVPFDPTRDDDPFELDESDVWSFSLSSDSYSYPNSTSPSPPSRHHLHRFNPVKSGLSAALSDERHNHIRRKSTVNPNIIPPAARKEDVHIPAKFRQSAPVNVPLWPKEFRGKKEKENWFDAVEDDDDEVPGGEEMVPPHVIVARSHVTYSVFEGAGRTLKGRDLRSVRNAVFQKTGFID